MNVEIPGQRRVIAYYGEDAQSMVHMEECAELIQAISKMRRVRNKGEDDSDVRRNLVEEMADVLICLEQLQEIYEIHDLDLEKVVNKKCARQDERLREGMGTPCI